MPIRKLAINFCLLLVVVALTLALAEALLRVVWPAPRHTNLRGITVPDDRLGYRLSPNSSLTVEGAMGDFATEVRTNRYGFRFPDYPLRRSPGTYRIALFGDSEVFGLGVDEAEMLNARMAEILNRGSDLDYEVLNFAMPAVGTVVEERILEEVAPDWKPDAVVFVVTVANDLLDDAAFTERDASRSSTAEDAPAARPGSRWSWLKRLRLYSLVRFRVLPYLPGFLLPPSSWFGELPPSVAAWYANDDLEADFAIMTGAIHRAKEVCDENGADMYLAALPTRSQFDPRTIRLLRNTTEPAIRQIIESDPERPERMLRAVAEANGVRYVPVLAEFRRLAAEDGAELKHPNDGHLNARGTLELAEILARAIRGTADGGASRRASAP